MNKELITRQEAIKLELKRYFTGKACPQGHIAERRVSSHCCVDCGVFHHNSVPKEERARRAHNEYVKNKNQKLEYQKQHRFKNKVRLKKRDKEYHIKNKKRRNVVSKKYKLSPANYSTYAPQLIGHKCRETEKGKLETTCKKCTKWFSPTTDHVMSRVKGINGKSNSTGAEHHLYCSDKCKSECDLWNAKEIPKSLRKTATRSRCNQTANRQSLLEIQTDNHGYNFCEKCGAKTDSLEIHHSIMVSENYKEADNVAHQILLCIDCHKKPEAHCRD
ncbi:hypothetical protein KAR91_57650 [Candidatus Pacearchaeota archaeon]|nr:hypothetical protein [Candidatus Pacearchaeota archaeon]